MRGRAEEAQTVLLFGASNLTYTDSDASEAIPALAERELEQRMPATA